jgi:6-phosphogluconolactonase (cycloisomerase 2 family)
VNAGSNELSVFSVRNNSLVLTDVVPSGGSQPISVTVAHNLIYVLNAGGAVGAADNISGFYLTERGQLHALPGSTQPLSGANVGPAQVSFGLRGDVLVVTEKATHLIDGFAVDQSGRAGPAMTRPSSGAVPFGFAISSKGFLFVSEAPASALSSYKVQDNGSLDLVTASLVNQQGAACWVVLSKDEKYAYTANATTDSISGYRIHENGALTLLDSNGLTAVAGDSPIDLAVSQNGRYLYALNAASGTIVGFRVGADGSLARVDEIGGLPAGGAGLVAR